jgi:hypothetical protein
MTDIRKAAEAALDDFLGQFGDDEQERILRYALDHVVPKLACKAAAASPPAPAAPAQPPMLCSGATVFEVEQNAATAVYIRAAQQAQPPTPESLVDALQEPVHKSLGPARTACNCRWIGEEQVQQCTLHAAHVEAIHEWAERAKTAEKAIAAQQAQPLTSAAQPPAQAAQRKPLTDEQIDRIWSAMGSFIERGADNRIFARSIQHACASAWGISIEGDDHE